MGHDKEILFPTDLDLINADLITIRRQLIDRGWVEVDFGFRLGRKTGALDIRQDENRFLIYKSNPADQLATDLLEKNNISHFNVTQKVNPATEKFDEIVVVKIPANTRPLDSMRFPDQTPQTGHLGSFEIIDAIAQLLANIAKKTNYLPNEIRLDNLALATGENGNIIKLMPPYNFSAVTDLPKAVERLTRQLAADLNSQDPISQHSEQLDHFQRRIRAYLTQQ